MPDRWTLRGAEFSNCSCAHGCPCQFNAPSTHGYCHAVGAGLIDEGHFNDTRLDGLGFVMLLKWPGEIADGNGEQQVLIEERADSAQREALRKILHGESTAPGATHFFVFNSTMSKVLETLYVPMEIEIDVEACRGRVHVPGMVDTHGSPMVDPHTGEIFRAGIHLPNGFEYTHAWMGNASSHVRAGLELDLTNSYGQFNVLHMNQDGVIR
jgi:hypothetical protein